MIKEDGYKFAFNPQACASCEGRCCTGESGYIWITPKEMQEVAKLLDMEFDEFTSSYVKKVGYRYSLVERKNDESFECVFFDSEKKQCGIYEARPKQCRTFPFWDSFKEDIDEVVKECPGIVLL
jgi:Fe-S-cluster containining protein